jgi:hypothetical protein
LEHVPCPKTPQEEEDNEDTGAEEKTGEHPQNIMVREKARDFVLPSPSLSPPLSLPGETGDGGVLKGSFSPL